MHNNKEIIKKDGTFLISHLDSSAGGEGSTTREFKYTLVYRGNVTRKLDLALSLGPHGWMVSDARQSKAK